MHPPLPHHTDPSYDEHSDIEQLIRSIRSYIREGYTDQQIVDMSKNPDGKLFDYIKAAKLMEKWMNS